MSDIKSKAVLLYYFSSSELLSHGKTALRKISDTLDIFLASKSNLSIIWYHDPKLDDYLKSDAPDIWQGYIALEKKFVDSASGILIKDPSKEESLIEECTAYYGSGGFLANSCVNAGKPVMIQDLSTTSALRNS